MPSSIDPSPRIAGGRSQPPSEDHVEPFRRLADSIPHVVWITELNPERVIYVSPSFEQVYGRTPQELYDDPRVWTACIHPDDRADVERQFVSWMTGMSRACQKLEYRVVTPEGKLRWVTDHGVVTFDSDGRPVRVSGVSTDITDLKLAEQEHLAHLHFLESLDRVNQAIQRANDLEVMMNDVLQVTLEAFGADHAWLAFPCESELPTWRVMIERHRDGAQNPYRGSDHAASRGGRAVLDAARALDDVIAFGGGEDSRVPPDLVQHFGVRSVLCTTLHPKVGTRYVFGLHQSVYERAWSRRERQLFREIARRLADAIGTLWTFRSLRESEARLEAAQKQARLGYWSLDVEAGVVTCSGEALRILGVDSSAGPLSIAEADDLCHPSDRARVEQARRAALDGGGGYALEYRTVSKAAGLRHVSSEGEVVRDGDGRAVGIFGTLQDITARKRAELLFATQHAVTRLLAEAVSIESATQRIWQVIGESLAWEAAVLWRSEPGTKRLRLSQIWSADGSFADDEGRDIDDLRAEAAAAGLQRVFQLPIELGCEMWGVVEFYARESQPHDSDLLSTMATIASQIRQFVERMEAEAALHQARDQLAHVTRVASLGELTASIAHEVNQPLTGIVANANAALRWLAHSPPEMGEAIEALRRLARDGKRAGEVIARLRTLVRKGEQSRKSPLDANQVVRETLPLIRSELQQNEVAVSLSLSRDLAQVRADRVQLQQVVLNLIVNAVEALAGQPGRPRELAISTRNQDEQVMIAVTDNGIGLSNENTERIFDPFFTTKPQGLGMGLAISRSIVEDHGGKLSVTSDRTGTTFEIKLRASR